MNIADPLDVLARTAWAEARSGGRLGMQSVCNVVMNRAAHPRWWGHDVFSICTKPWQFSCWNPLTARQPEDANFKAMAAVGHNDALFVIALDLARRALAGALPDITGGADSYYDAGMRVPPKWAADAVFTAEIAGQRFYRVELPAPAISSPVVEQTAECLNAAELARVRGET